MLEQWLQWGRRLQAIAQTGLAYGKDPFDVERFEQVRTIASEIFGAHANLPTPAIERLFTAQAGYATPKVDVRAAVFRDGEILLVKETSDGLWTLPGGWADVGESPAECVAKEVHEESGFEVKVTKVLAVYDRDRHGHAALPFAVYKLVFLCEIVGGQAAASVETSEVAFFPRDRLPALSLTRVVPHQILNAFAHLDDPTRATDFD